MNGMAAPEEDRFVERVPPSRAGDRWRPDTISLISPSTQKVRRDNWRPMALVVPVERVPLADGRELVFRDAIGCHRQRRGEEYSVEIGPLGVEGTGTTFQGAWQDLANKVWNEAERMLRTPSHTLDGEALERKGLLLGHVDVVRSRIARSSSKLSSVLGRLERDTDGKVWFRESSSAGTRFAIDPTISGTLPEDRFLRLGKVRTDEFGRRTGLVVEFGEPLDDDADETSRE